MKKFLLFVSFALVIFACDEDLEYGTAYENESISGIWNLNGVRSYECGSFDVVIGNIDDTTFYFNVDSIFLDSFIIDPVLGDTIGKKTTVVLDTMYFTRNGVVGYEEILMTEIDPFGVGESRILKRYELQESDTNIFEVNYTFDTVFFDDYVIHYDPCSSVFQLDGDGTGSYTGKIFGNTSGGGKLFWSDKGMNVYSICLDTINNCRDYEVRVSSEGGMSWTDKNFNTNDCNKAQYSFKQAEGYIGEYTWTEVRLEDCFGDSDSIISYTDLFCNVSRDSAVVNTVGAVCYKFTVECDDVALLEIVDGPNEGVVRLNYSEVSNGSFVANPTGNATADKLNFTILDSVLVLNVNEVTTLEGYTCPLEIKFKKK